VAGITPSQTVGPFLHLGLRAGLASPELRTATHDITIEGRLIDGDGRGIPDGVLECWWAAGTEDDGTPKGEFRRVFTGVDGMYSLTASRPCPVPGPNGESQSPHMAVLILGRGILNRYATRIYFADDPSLERDAILNFVPKDRRSTLMAHAIAPNHYRFDIVLQGEKETVFFDV
jgi:protocatechuate 3,4-dioxygenase alpha subunit